MITVKNVAAPSSTAEAYDMLLSNRFATFLGGGAFLRMGSKNISTLIDLSHCGLGEIKERKDDWEIGGMVTLGDLERHVELNHQYDGLLKASVKDIVGVQLRNIVTTGASVYARYGFSDLITGLLSLPVQVKLHHKGLMTLEDFLAEGSGGRDLLEAVIIKKGNCVAHALSIRKTTGDYALLNAAVAKTNGELRISVGARPGRARLARKAMAQMEHCDWTETSMEEAARTASTEMPFGSNSRADREYRQQLCRVLVKRALREVARRETEYND